MWLALSHNAFLIILAVACECIPSLCWLNMLHYEQTTVSTTCQLIELGAAMNYAIMNMCEGFGVDYFSSLGYVSSRSQWVM